MNAILLGIYLVFCGYVVYCVLKWPNGDDWWR
jgi:hypothetical protein